MIKTQTIEIYWNNFQLWAKLTYIHKNKFWVSNFLKFYPMFKTNNYIQVDKKIILHKLIFEAFLFRIFYADYIFHTTSSLTSIKLNHIWECDRYWRL